jgi:hypothetical protein
MSDVWLCPLCGKEMKQEFDSVLGHMKEAHAPIFNRFPNPLVPRDNMFKVPDR